MLLRKFCLSFAILLISCTVYADDVLFGNAIDSGRIESYNVAQNKFTLTNVKPAHDDFKSIIEASTSEDFVLLDYAILLAEFGLFDLSDSIFSKISDYDVSKHYIKDIKRFYYPVKRLDESVIISLAEAYAGIKYNNYAQEAILEIVNNSDLMNRNLDYAYYVLALGYYETKDFVQALNYITLATTQNDANINYKVLQIKILLEVNQKKKALALLKKLKEENFSIDFFNKKIMALEQYVLYKSSKSENQKDYHLGFYYLLENKANFAQKVLLDGISNNKKLNGGIYSLLAGISLPNDKLHSTLYANKALKTGHATFEAPYVLGVIEYDNNRRQAMRFLNKAASMEKQSSFSDVQIATNLYNMGKLKQARKRLVKVTKKTPSCAMSYYQLSFLLPEEREHYLKKSLSYDVKLLSAYYELCKLYIERENYELAEDILNNVLYIDEKDFKYYYYLSQIEFSKGNSEMAHLLLEKCSVLEPNYRDIINKEYGIEK